MARSGTTNDYWAAALITYRHATQLTSEWLDVWDCYGRVGLELAGAQIGFEIRGR